MCAECVQIPESEEEVGGMPLRGLRLSGHLEIGVVQVDPTVAAGVGSAYGCAQAEPEMEVVDRFDESRNGHGHVVEVQGNM